MVINTSEQLSETGEMKKAFSEAILIFYPIKINSTLAIEGS